MLSGRSRFPLGADWPFAPARLPLFYGWVILGLATAGMLMSIPGQTAGVSVFTDPLIAATGLTRVELANAYLVGTVVSGLLLPLGGRVLDRRGARVTAMVASTALGLTLVYLSAVDHIAAGLGALVGLDRSPVVAACALTTGFAALRFSGQGLLTLASRVMVVKWFERRRGLVSGVFSVFITIGFSFAPALLAAWIDAAGSWRTAWQSMALVVGVGMTGIAWLAFRDNPEECGLGMDGDAPHDATADEPSRAGAPANGATLREAMRTGAFWSVTLGLAIQAAVMTGITFHIVDLGAEAGLSRVDAVGLFPPIALVGVLIGFVAGAASDRFPLRVLMAVLVVGQAVGCIGFARLDHAAWTLAAIAGIGAAAGLFSALSTLAPAKLFGRAHVGAISSAQMSAMVIGSALGPSLLAVSRQDLGSYAPALYATAVLPGGLALLTALSRAPAPAGRGW